MQTIPENHPYTNINYDPDEQEQQPLLVRWSDSLDIVNWTNSKIILVMLSLTAIMIIIYGLLGFDILSAFASVLLLFVQFLGIYCLTIIDTDLDHRYLILILLINIPCMLIAKADHYKDYVTVGIAINTLICIIIACVIAAKYLMRPF